MAGVTDPAKLPIFIVFEGGAGPDRAGAPAELFRLAPADEVMARRLADYIANARRRSR